MRPVPPVRSRSRKLPGVEKGDISPTEALAIAQIEAVLGARGEHLDTEEAPDGMRDFDLVFSDGRREPVEVTSHASSSAFLRTQNRISRESRPPATVRNRWMVTVPPTNDGAPANLRIARPLLVSLIEKLDADGFTDLDTAALAYPFEPDRYQDEARALLDLGIRHASAAPPREGEPGWIELRLGFSGFISAHAVVDALEYAAGRPDNQSKLSGSAAARRHLIVVMTEADEEMSAPALRDLISEHHVPVRKPQLPDAITTVWAVGVTGGVWITLPGEWEGFGWDYEAGCLIDR